MGLEYAPRMDWPTQRTRTGPATGTAMIVTATLAVAEAGRLTRLLALPATPYATERAA